MWSRLSSLLPLGVDTDNTAQGTSKTDDAVIEEGNPSETGDGNEDIAKIAEELLLGGSALNGDGLALNNTLTLLQINL